MRFRIFSRTVLSVVWLGGCVLNTPPGSSDSGTPDGGAVDSGSEGSPDSGAPGVDSGTPDSGTPDSGYQWDGGYGPDGGSCRPSLPGIGNQGRNCRTCTQAACGTDVTAADTACSAYSQCVCACSGNPVSCGPSCASSVTSDCQAAMETILGCAQQNCEAQCFPPDGGPLPPSDGGGPPPPPDGGNPPPPLGDGGLLPDGGDACGPLGACCASLPSNLQTECQNVAASGNESNCSSALSLAQGQGYCP